MNQGQNAIAEGMTVYDSMGDKVGTVREYNAQAGYVDVEKGWLFHKDFYIPLNAIARTDQDGVYLNLQKDDLSGDAYSQPPIAGVGTGYGATAATYDTTQTTDYGTTQTAGYDTVQTAQTAGYTTAGQQATTTNTVDTTTTGTGDIRVPVYEEELVVGKRQEEAGRVRLHKEVEAEQQSIPVTLEREQVTVERVPVDQAVDPATLDDAFQNTDIEVPVMGEEAIVGKRLRAVEEVRLHKDVTQEQEQVSDTVRRERVVVDGVEQTGATMNTTTSTTTGTTGTTLQGGDVTLDNTTR